MRSINYDRGKTNYQKRTNTENGNFDTRLNTRFTGNQRCRFCNAPKRYTQMSYFRIQLPLLRKKDTPQSRVNKEQASPDQLKNLRKK